MEYDNDLTPYENYLKQYMLIISVAWESAVERERQYQEVIKLLEEVDIFLDH